MATTPIGTGAAFDDSNVAMMGSDAAHDAMRDAAALDPAWESAGTAAGIEIWRVENHARTAGDAGGSGGKAAHFGIKRWTRPDVLYTGDSYIILLTKPVEDGGEGFDYDIYFWLGHESSQDERGVAAYKTVELSDLLTAGDVTQHRETNPGESDHFLALFPGGAPRFLGGGIASGFTSVEAEAYAPRLLSVKGKKQFRVVQCPAVAASSMNQGDVYLLDLGLKIIQWNGAESSVWERRQAGDEARKIKAARGKSSVEYVQIDDAASAESAEFFDALDGGPDDVLPASAGGDDRAVASVKMELHRLTEDESDGSISFTKIATGKKHMKRDLLDPTDVFVLDCGRQIYVWIGSGASKKERSSVWEYAEKYCASDEIGECTPITVVHEKNKNPPSGFTKAFTHHKSKAGGAASPPSPGP